MILQILQSAGAQLVGLAAGVAALIYLGRRLLRIGDSLVEGAADARQTKREILGWDGDERTGAPRMPGVIERIDGLERAFESVMTGLAEIAARLNNGLSSAVDTLQKDMSSIKGTVTNLQETSVRVDEALAAQTAQTAAHTTRTDERLGIIETQQRDLAEKVEALTANIKIGNDPAFWREAGLDRRHPPAEDDDGVGT